MKGINKITDEAGELKEIHISVADAPEISTQLIRLISSFERAQAIGNVTLREENKIENGQVKSPMSVNELEKLIRVSKASGVLNPEELFQTYPQWKANAPSSLPGSPASK